MYVFESFDKLHLRLTLTQDWFSIVSR